MSIVAGQAVKGLSGAQPRVFAAANGPMGGMSNLRGRRTETLAASYLKQRGYAVLESRYRTAAGEIDIIAEKDNILHIREVTGCKTLDRCRNAISERQQSRICNAAEIYLSEHFDPQKNVQIDAIFVSQSQICFLEDAWRAA
jgi:putative endonuclease